MTTSPITHLKTSLALPAITAVPVQPSLQTIAAVSVDDPSLTIEIASPFKAPLQGKHKKRLLEYFQKNPAVIDLLKRLKELIPQRYKATLALCGSMVSSLFDMSQTPQDVDFLCNLEIEFNRENYPRHTDEQFQFTINQFIHCVFREIRDYAQLLIGNEKFQKHFLIFDPLIVDSDAKTNRFSILRFLNNIELKTVIDVTIKSGSITTHYSGLKNTSAFDKDSLYIPLETILSTEEIKNIPDIYVFSKSCPIHEARACILLKELTTEGVEGSKLLKWIDYVTFRGYGSPQLLGINILVDFLKTYSRSAAEDRIKKYLSEYADYKFGTTLCLINLSQISEYIPDENKDVVNNLVASLLNLPKEHFELHLLWAKCVTLLYATKSCRSERDDEHFSFLTIEAETKNYSVLMPKRPCVLFIDLLTRLLELGTSFSLVEHHRSVFRQIPFLRTIQNDDDLLKSLLRLMIDYIEKYDPSNLPHFYYFAKMHFPHLLFGIPTKKISGKIALIPIPEIYLGTLTQGLIFQGILETTATLSTYKNSFYDHFCLRLLIKAKELIPHESLLKHIAPLIATSASIVSDEEKDAFLELLSCFPELGTTFFENVKSVSKMVDCLEIVILHCAQTNPTLSFDLFLENEHFFISLPQKAYFLYKFIMKCQDTSITELLWQKLEKEHLLNKFPSERLECFEKLLSLKLMKDDVDFLYLGTYALKLKCISPHSAALAEKLLEIGTVESVHIVGSLLEIFHPKDHVVIFLKFLTACSILSDEEVKLLLPKIIKLLTSYELSSEYTLFSQNLLTKLIRVEGIEKEMINMLETLNLSFFENSYLHKTLKYLITTYSKENAYQLIQKFEHHLIDETLVIKFAEDLLSGDQKHILMADSIIFNGRCLSSYHDTLMTAYKTVIHLASIDFTKAVSRLTLLMQMPLVNNTLQTYATICIAWEGLPKSQYTHDLFIAITHCLDHLFSRLCFDRNSKIIVSFLALFDGCINSNNIDLILECESYLRRKFRENILTGDSLLACYIRMINIRSKLKSPNCDELLELVEEIIGNKIFDESTPRHLWVKLISDTLSKLLEYAISNEFSKSEKILELITEYIFDHPVINKKIFEITELDTTNTLLYLLSTCILLIKKSKTHNLINYDRALYTFKALFDNRSRHYIGDAGVEINDLIVKQCFSFFEIEPSFDLKLTQYRLLFPLLKECITLQNSEQIQSDKLILLPIFIGSTSSRLLRLSTSTHVLSELLLIISEFECTVQELKKIRLFTNWFGAIDNRARDAYIELLGLRAFLDARYAPKVFEYLQEIKDYAPAKEQLTLQFRQIYYLTCKLYHCISQTIAFDSAYPEQFAQFILKAIPAKTAVKGHLQVEIILNCVSKIIFTLIELNEPKLIPLMLNLFERFETYAINSEHATKDLAKQIIMHTCRMPLFYPLCSKLLHHLEKRKILSLSAEKEWVKRFSNMIEESHENYKVSVLKYTPKVVDFSAISKDILELQNSLMSLLQIQDLPSLIEKLNAIIEKAKKVKLDERFTINTQLLIGDFERMLDKADTISDSIIPRFILMPLTKGSAFLRRLREDLSVTVPVNIAPTYTTKLRYLALLKSTTTELQRFLDSKQ